MTIELNIEYTRRKKFTESELNRIVSKLNDFCGQLEDSFRGVTRMSVIIDNHILSDAELKQRYEEGMKEVLSEVREISQ